TLNSVHASIVDKAHQCSAKYPEGVSEFEATGLTPEYLDEWPVPVVKESALRYALQLVEIVPIRHNDTFLVIGSIEHVWVRDDLVGADGFLHLQKAEVVASTGLDAYYLPKFLARFAYARPDELPGKISGQDEE
ncbi:MAG TPA: flavin reductase, partial [Phnomibacter sp.]|nr:flavin reductase [Phnomibacter sp.]